MKTYAMGRFLINLPEMATNVAISQRILGADVKWKAATDAQYRSLLLTRVDALKGMGPATQLLVSDEEMPIPQSRIIIFEKDDERNGLLGFEAYRCAAEFDGYFFISGTVARTKTSVIKPWVSEIFTLVQPRNIESTMRERGACFDHGFVSGGDPEWGESASILANLDGVTMIFSTQVIDSVDEGPSLLERARKLAGFPEIKALRQRKRVLAGLDGAEVSFVDTLQAASKYSLQWEFEGNANSIAAPKIIAGVQSTSATSVSEMELLGLWDAILESIRLRPGVV